MPAAKTALEIAQVCKLLQLVYNNDKAQIEKLISNGIVHLVNYNEPERGRTAMIVAVVSNNDDMLDFLLSLGAHPDVVDFKGRSAAMVAAEYGHIQCLEKLIQCGASMKLVDLDGKGILFYLLFPSERHANMFNLAIQNGAEMDVVAKDGTTALVMACDSAIVNENICLNFLKHGANPNLSNEKTNRTPIMAASNSGSLVVVQALLQKGGSPNGHDWRKNTAAHFAAKGGYFDVLVALAGFGANFDTTNNEGKTPLHLAAKNNHGLCCRFLCSRGCNPKVKSCDDYTARLLAKDLGNKQALKECKKGEKIFGKLGKNFQRWSVLLYDWLYINAELIAEESASIGNTEGNTVVDASEFRSLLVKLNVPISEEDLNAVIKMYTKAGNLDVKEFMVCKKFVNKVFLITSFLGKPKKPKKDRGGKGGKGKFKLPMVICTHDDIQRTDGGNPPIEFIPYTACITDINRFDRDNPPIHPLQDDSAWYMRHMDVNFININDAVRCNDKISIETAIAKGTPVDTKDKYFKTPLMIACALGNVDMVKMLLEKKANVNVMDNFKWTALHHACHGGQLDVVKLIIENGADINAPSLNGGTPLTRAIESSAFEVVQFLIDSGAKLQTETRNGLTPVDIAHSFADPRVIGLIDSTYTPPDDKKAKQKKKPSSAKKEGSAQAKDMAATKSLSERLEEVNLRSDEKRHIQKMAAAILENVDEVEDISYTPRRAWIQMSTTDQLIEDMVKKRQQFGWEVDFPDFRMPFDKNIANKITDIIKEEESK